MSVLIALDGTTLGGGRTLRAALTLSAVSGKGFELTKIRAGDPRAGLRAEETAVVRAAALCCQARVSGAFDGSPDLRFEPGSPAAGDYHFELPGAASATVVLQAVLPILAAAQARSRIDVVGGTHVPEAPTFEFLARHWLAAVARLGLRAGCRLERAGFQPAGEGELSATAESWVRPASPLDLTRRGALLALRGVSVSARVRGEVALRQREACSRRLWEERRLEVEWENVEAKSARPGSYLYVEAVFEHSRAAFTHLGQRGLGPEGLGERVARRLLLFLEEQAEAAQDAHLAEQLVVPLALTRGGSLTTPEVGAGLERLAAVVAAFGGGVRVDGRVGGPGRVEVDAC